MTAQQNVELLDFLNHYKQSFAKRGINVSLTVQTDMPKNPGRKGGVPTKTVKRDSYAGLLGNRMYVIIFRLRAFKH